jgi:MSHA biogenesis protein MshK
MSMRALVSICAVLALPAAAATLHDPTQPPTNWRGAGPVASAATKADPRLTSVLISANRRLAVIDGVTVSEGQSIGEIDVLHIGPTWVDARVGGTPVRLALGGANMTKDWR